MSDEDSGPESGPHCAHWLPVDDGDHPADAAPCETCGHSCHDHYAGGGPCFNFNGSRCNCVDYANAAWPAGQVSSVADQAAAAAERERQQTEWQTTRSAEDEATLARGRACRDDWERRQAEKARKF